MLKNLQKRSYLCPPMKKSNCYIYKAEKQDMKDVLELIHGLAIYEKAPDAVEIDLVQLEQDGFGEEPLFEVFLAKVNGEVAGMALYYNTYSTWKGRMMYLEDLFVKEAYRRSGVATQLMETLIAVAKAKNAKRIKWQVLDWNQPAIDFYKKLNANFDSEWVNCDLYEDQINNFKA